MKRNQDIQILITLNQAYLPRLQVMLTSMHSSQPDEKFDIWLLHNSIPEESLEPVTCQCRALGYAFHPVTVDSAAFTGAPVSRQYPREMYYRLLAPFLLPRRLHRILYLDPDILVINPLRLGTDHAYFNSGVLLMDLDQGRNEIIAGDIFNYTREHARELLLPDQDILNAMYGYRTLPVDDSIWNYDARNYNTYLLRSGGVCDMDWVMKYTSVLHFCGKSKPWQKGYIHRFGILYKHYGQLTQRMME